MFKTTLIAAALVSLGAAQAEELRPQAGHTIELAATTGSIYYTEEAEGFRVVATMAGLDGSVPVRFTAMLSDGQAVTVSVPVEGRESQEIEISRNGQTLSVEPVEAPIIRASLD